MTKLILAASAAILIATPALAAEVQADAPTQAVSARHVDFTNRDQVKRFYAQLRGAAQAVCGAGSFSTTDAACVRQVMAQAVQSANKPILTAVYDANQPSTSNRAFAGNDQ